MESQKMLPVEDVSIEVIAVLGRTSMPIGRLVRMGRGAMIELDSHIHSPVRLYANDRLVAYGELMIQGDRLVVHVTDRPERAKAGARKAA